VALAQLTLMGGNLLVLDEPTNHLDIGAREALETVLNEYNGSILFVSHDRYFIDAVADTIWMVDNGSIEKFDGTYSEYVAWKESVVHSPSPVASSQQQRPVKAEQLAANHGPATTANGQRTTDKQDRKRQRKLAALEDEIAMLEAELNKLTGEMTAASMEGDGKRVKSLEMQYGDIQEMLSARYDEWASVAG
jgi:ATP-binding cassette, subfamily F, member 3